LELWALGDLALATPFLQAVSDCYDVTLLAKSTALELQPLFWPQVKVIEFSLPWTAFRRKYALHQWPWRRLASLTRQLRKERFDIAVSARWDPRDHLLMALTGARRRIGYSRLCSRFFLTQAPPRPDAAAHRYEYWRRAAQCLGVEMPVERPCAAIFPSDTHVVLHTGAGQKARVWPLERYAGLMRRLRQFHVPLRVLCDADQAAWWQSHGEEPCVPASLPELTRALRGASLFVGNDSGPGHLAALLGVPTFTLFGNQVASRFSPLNQLSRWVEGHDCPHKPCYDSCRFDRPHCLMDVTEEEAWLQLEPLARRCLTQSP
jgi:ADP-heptose:LPS heptosyltransferase